MDFYYLTLKQILLVKIFFWLISWGVDLDAATWDDAVIERLSFLSHSVLQIPFLLMTLMSYITPTMDAMYELFFPAPILLIRGC